MSEDDIPVPETETLPDPIQEALQARSVGRTHVNYIVRTVVTLVRTKKIKGRNIHLAAKCANKLVKTWSPLKLKAGKNNVSLKLSA